MWALVDCYLSLLWKMHWCLWVFFPISWEHMQINHYYWCIAYWFLRNFLDSIKIREWIGNLKSMLPVLRHSHLFLFGCLLKAMGSRAILDIIRRMLCTCTYISCLGWECFSLAQFWCFHQLCSTAVFFSYSEQILQLWSVAYAEFYIHPLLLILKSQKILSFHK